MCRELKGDRVTRVSVLAGLSDRANSNFALARLISRRCEKPAINLWIHYHKLARRGCVGSWCWRAMRRAVPRDQVARALRVRRARERREKRVCAVQWKPGLSSRSWENDRSKRTSREEVRFARLRASCYVVSSCPRSPRKNVVEDTLCIAHVFSFPLEKIVFLAFVSMYTTVPTQNPLFPSPFYLVRPLRFIEHGIHTLALWCPLDSSELSVRQAVEIRWPRERKKRKQFTLQWINAVFYLLRCFFVEQKKRSLTIEDKVDSAWK